MGQAGNVNPTTDINNKSYRHKSNATSEVNWFSQAGMGQAGNVNPTTDMTNKSYRHKSNATSEVNWFSQAGMGQAGNVNPTTDMTWPTNLTDISPMLQVK